MPLWQVSPRQQTPPMIEQTGKRTRVWKLKNEHRTRTAEGRDCQRKERQKLKMSKPTKLSGHDTVLKFIETVKNVFERQSTNARIALSNNIQGRMMT